MREIKFRAWDGKKMLSWDEIGDEPGNLQVTMLANVFNDGSLVFMQYTGLIDSSGVEIYEGDIFEFDKVEWGGADNIHLVSWNNDEGCWDWGGGSSDDMEYRKVIGNIYQNPELLEK